MVGTGIFTLIQAITVGIITLMTLISLGIVGQQITYIHDFKNTQQFNYLKDHHKVYLQSMNSIMAFNVFFLIYILPLIYGAYNFQKKNFMCLMITFFVIIWLPRWISSIVFLEGDDDYRSQ